MKRFVKGFYKLVAGFVAAVIFCNTVFCDVLTVQAAEVVASYSVLESLLLLLGIDLGLGYQPDFVKDSYDDFSDIVQAWSAKDTVTIGGYGTVDFSDADSIASYFEWANSASSATSVLEDGYVDDVYNALKTLDQASYSNTGSSASNGLRDSISSYYGDYNGSSEALAEDCDTVFTVINGGGNLNNDDNDDDNDNNIKWYQKALALLGLFGIGVISHGDVFDNLSVADDTIYTDYDFDAFSSYDELYDSSTGLYNYSLYGYYNKNGPYLFTYSSKYKVVCTYSSGSSLISYWLWYYDGSDVYSASFKYGSNSSYCFYSDYATYVFVGCNFPIICDGGMAYDTAVKAYLKGTLSADNYNENNYNAFVSNFEGATKFFEDNGLYKYLATVKPGDDLTSTIAPLADAAKSYNGTSMALTSVSNAIADNTPAVNPDSDSDSDSSSGVSINYTSILTRILNGVLAIPKGIWEFFMDPITAIRDTVVLMPPLVQSILDLIVGIPDGIQSLVDGLFNIQDVLLPVIQTLPDTYRGFALGLDEIPDTLTSIWTELSAQLKDFKEGVIPSSDPDINPYIPFISQMLDRLQSIDDALNADTDSDSSTNPGVDTDNTDSTEPVDPDNPGDSDNGDGSGFSLGLLNGLLLLIYILFMLLRIFLHLLEFIVNIFKIGADPGFITGDFAVGFNFIKSVELDGMGVSVYDFLMILVHISVIFAVVKVLRQRIEKLHFS
jgi:hypothetical protein